MYGLRNAGLADYVAQALHWFGAHGRVASALGTGFLAALFSSMMNNMPAVLLVTLRALAWWLPLA
ncbi:ArsB/NhaD family transporter [Acidithiobacillus sp.]|uniref:ArsB/NhaD family transporter n=1 Tax=Acidithiobacillus sp. TaxID=1872118 RepID=UPI002629BA81|nr:ArsB/NhaD family transporter [Acidithiobacillus sp.]